MKDLKHMRELKRSETIEKVFRFALAIISTALFTLVTVQAISAIFF